MTSSYLSVNMNIYLHLGGLELQIHATVWLFDFPTKTLKAFLFFLKTEASKIDRDVEN